MARFEFYDLPPEAKDKLIDLGREMAANRMLLAAHRFLRVLHKANFNPNQPRAPRGNPDGGQWARDGGSSTGAGALPSRLWLRKPTPISGVVNIAYKPGAPQEGPPHIPKDAPASAQVRNTIFKATVTWLARAALADTPGVGEVWLAVEAASWAEPYVRSYFDLPKTLEELQQAASDPQTGYQIHHIVEQASAKEGDVSLIDAPDNLVRVPTLKHWAINGWYSRPNGEYGGVSPRDYLRDKNWKERQQVGRDALIKFKVLKP